MKRLILAGAMLAAGAAAVLAQPTGQAGAAAPQAQAPEKKGPAPKSQAELTALQALNTAVQSGDADALIKACEDLRANFPDTDFKAWSLSAEATAYQQKRDFIKAQIFAKEAIDADPKSFQAALLLADLISQHTGEHDLDRDEQIGKAQTYAKQAIDLVSNAPKPNSQLTDDQWTATKKGIIGQAYHDIALSETVRKNWDAAIAAFKLAIQNDDQPAYKTQMASAYQQSGKNDDAIALCDQVLAVPSLDARIKNAATAIKNAATQAKEKGGK